MSPLLLFLLTYCPATLAERQGYNVCYDTQNQRALWTSHTPQSSTAPTPRKHWRKDHELNSLPSSAFTNTGFDRGHLATAADLPNSPDTYLTSNAIAQDPTLNRNEWRKLENQLRKQRAAQVTTGAIYDNCGIDREMWLLGQQSSVQRDPGEIHLLAEQASKTVHQLEARARHYTREINRIIDTIRKLQAMPVSLEAAQVMNEIIELGTEEVPEPPTEDAQEPPIPAPAPQPARKPVQRDSNKPEEASIPRRK